MNGRKDISPTLLCNVMKYAVIEQRLCLYSKAADSDLKYQFRLADFSVQI